MMTVRDLRALIEPLTDEAEILIDTPGGVLRPYGWALELVSGSAAVVLSVDDDEVDLSHARAEEEWTDGENARNN